MTATRPTVDVRPLVVGLLVAWNVTATLATPALAVVVLNLAVATVLVGIARRGGASWRQLGLGPGALARGLRLGVVAAVIVAATVVGVAMVPGSDVWFADRRLVGIGGAAMVGEVLVRIPLGTAVAEEVAFRGVVVGVWLERSGRRQAIAVSSTLFGLWHVLPGVTAAASSTALGSGVLVTAVAVVGQVVVTALAGVALAWLRFRADSVVAPALAHWALNAAGYAVAWATVADGAG